MTTEVHHTVTKLGSDYCNLQEYIKQLQDIWDKVPKEFQEKVQIDVSASENYGNAEVDIEIFYLRPENAAETASRKKREDMYEEHQRKQYQALKAKFG